MADHPPRNEMWVTCKACARTWVLAFLPIEVGKLAKLMKSAACAKCGERKGITMATEAEIVSTLQLQRAGGI